MTDDFLKSKDGQIIKGPILLSTETYKDERGLFYESWNMNSFNKEISNDINFVQDNISISNKGVLRGLHYQLNPFSQGKLIRCIKGAIFDVIVDLREESKTFLEWASIELSDRDFKQLWIPVGFAHGFLTISDKAIVNYKVDNFWNPKSERSIKWDDKEIKIKWPLEENGIEIPYLSKKDSSGKTILEAISRGECFK